MLERGRAARRDERNRKLGAGDARHRVAQRQLDFASKTEWGKPLVNSLFTLGLMIGISVHDITVGTTVANLGMRETVFPHPVFHGDTISVETEVLSARESKSKPDRGIVEFEHRAFNQHGTLVAKCIRQAMMLKRPA